MGLLSQNLLSRSTLFGSNINSGKQDIGDYLINLPIGYIPISLVDKEGLWCVNGNFNKAYLLNIQGTLIKTVTLTSDSFMLMHASPNHMCWSCQDRSIIIITDKSGTVVYRYTEQCRITNACINEVSKIIYLASNQQIRAIHYDNSIIYDKQMTSIYPCMIIPVKNGICCIASYISAVNNMPDALFISDSGVTKGLLNEFASEGTTDTYCVQLFTNAFALA